MSTTPGPVIEVFADIWCPFAHVGRRAIEEQCVRAGRTLMSTAGLMTEGIFGAAGLIPTVRPTTIAPAHFSWNYAAYLNIVFLALFGFLCWTYRNRDRLGAGTGYAKDPV